MSNLLPQLLAHFSNFLAICSINYKNKKLQFAGAFNPLYIIQNDEINVIKGDKYAVGSFSSGEDIDYQNHVINLKEGDTFYIFSDGYPDQFGGPKNKKYLYKRFREFLLSPEIMSPAKNTL